MKSVLALLCFLISSHLLSAEVHYRPGDRTPIKLHRNDVLVIDLDTVSDGGYSWQLTGPLRRLRLLSKDGHPEERASSDGSHRIVGAPTITTFRFKAVSKGKGRFRLVYGRPWELRKGKKPTKVVWIRVLVR